MNCKCSRRNSWHQIAWTRAWPMKFNIDQCQERYLGKRQFKLYRTSSWVATNMLERGPAVAVSMKITAQHSVKVKKLNKIEFWISRKAKKKASIFALYKPMVSKHFNHAVRDLSLLHLSQIKHMRTEKKFSNMTRMARRME